MFVKNGETAPHKTWCCPTTPRTILHPSILTPRFGQDAFPDSVPESIQDSPPVHSTPLTANSAKKGTARSQEAALVSRPKIRPRFVQIL
jgi:hypothetical protein